MVGLVFIVFIDALLNFLQEISQFFHTVGEMVR